MAENIREKVSRMQSLYETLAQALSEATVHPETIDKFFGSYLRYFNLP